MGDNYRASDTQPNEHWQQLVRRIRAGETAGQKRRAFQDKLVVGGAMAGLTGVAGLAKASQSYTDEMDQKRGVMKKAIGQATMADAIGRATKEDRFNRTFRPEQGPQKPAEGSAPAWLGEHGEGNAAALGQSAEPVDVSLLADRAKANQGLNSSAGRSEIGGYRTREGGQEHADIASSIARDIATSRQGIAEGQQMGGMGQSLVRNPAPDMMAPADTYRDPTDEYFGTTGGR